MEKYIIEYEDYDDILSLLGHGVPHTKYGNVSTIVVELTTEEYEALVGAGIQIHPNYEIKLCSTPSALPGVTSYPTLPPYINTYLNITNAHAAGFDGRGVKISLPDSGCNPSGSNVCRDVVLQDYTGLGTGDDINHGGKACVIMNQRYGINSGLDIRCGIAYGATIYSKRVIEGGLSAMIAALSDTITEGLHIVNMSFDVGGGLTNAVNACMAAGIICVAASGNSVGGIMAHPANIPGVIAVNVVDVNSPNVPIGTHITSDGDVGLVGIMFNGGSYEVFNGGTSQAAFMVSALLAIYKQKYPSLDTQGAMNLLRRRALKMDGFVYDHTCNTKWATLNYQTGAGFIAPVN